MSYKFAIHVKNVNTDLLIGLTVSIPRNIDLSMSGRGPHTTIQFNFAL
jgi:hypothetical protein